MSAERLSDLREPPVAGRFYMVPAVQFNWLGKFALWPVLGPLHTDADILNFPSPHYHVDARFVSKSLARRVSSHGGDAAALAQRFPLAQRRYDSAEVPRGRPALHRMKCQTSEFPYHFHAQPVISTLRTAYGDLSPSKRAEPIRLADGRILCPHRKVDLSAFKPDDEGVVTCPLHGLRVCVRATPEAHSREEGE